MEEGRADQLSRAQRSQSYQNFTSHSAFSPLSQLTTASSASSLPSLTHNLTSQSVPATPLHPPRNFGLSENHFPFDATYSERGFEVDPFSTTPNPNRGRRSRKESLGVGKGVFGAKKAKSAVFYRDSDWADRLSAKASLFGGWTEGERRVEEWSGRCKAGDETDSDASDDEEQPESTLDDSPRIVHMARTKSSLSVFHDEFETSDEPHQSTSPFASPSSSHTRLNSLSFTSSPSSTRSSLPPQTPLTMSPNPQQHATLHQGEMVKDPETSPEDIDILAHSVLASQDRFGLFALVESFLEWPWSPKSSAPEATSLPVSSGEISSRSSYSSYSPSPALSRAPSLMSLSESGELSAYYRAKSESDLKRKLEWEKGERERSGNGLGIIQSEKKEDGIGAVMDILSGLNNLL